MTTAVHLRALLVCLLALAAVGQARAQTGWTRFRGPDGTGVFDEPSIPVTFTEADYRWRTELPGSGHSSPVLSGGKVFLTCEIEDADERLVVCLDAADGRVLWSWKDTFESYGHHSFNSFAASTPAVDAEGVYLSWISGNTFVVTALDHHGKQVWQHRWGDFKSQFGAGASPIVLDGLVIAGNDHAGESSFLIALDAKTGETRWKVARRSGYASYITPAVYRPKGGPVELIFVSPSHGVSSLDPGTGKLNWEADGLFTLKTVASPVIADGLIFASGGRGGGGRESAVVRPADRASASHADRVYEIESDLPYVPTPVAVGKHLFLWSDGGVVSCLQAANGRVVWQEKVGGRYFSSPICISGRIYGTSREGEVVVIEAGTQYKLLGRSKLPEGSHATPAVAGGRIYFRTFSQLICIGGESR